MPDTEITILEAFEDNKLFVMKADMQKFLPQDSSVQAEVKSEVKPPKVDPTKTTPVAEDIAPTLPTQTGEVTASKPRLPSSKISTIFDGIMGNKKSWQRLLSNRPKWLLENGKARCPEGGRRGKDDPIWDPFEIAKILVEVKNIDCWKLDPVFRNNKYLSPWARQWMEYMDNKYPLGTPKSPSPWDGLMKK